MVTQWETRRQRREERRLREPRRRMQGIAGGSSEVEVGKEDSGLMSSPEQLEPVPEPQGLKAET